MPPMNARVTPSFQRPLFPSHMPQKSNLEVMIENMLMTQQKQDEYIKQLASKVDVFTTHNRMLAAQIAQKAAVSSTPPDRLPSNLEPNPCEHCNCVTMKEDEEDLTDFEEVPKEEGREITMAGSKESNYSSKTATFVENDSIQIPTIFPPKLLDLGSFSIPCIVGKVEIERGLCDLGTSVSIMPYSFFYKLYRGPLLATPFSPQLANGSVT